MHLNKNVKNPLIQFGTSFIFIFFPPEHPPFFGTAEVLSQEIASGCYSTLHPCVLCKPTARRILLSGQTHWLPTADSSYRSKSKPSSYLHFLALLFVSAHWTSPIAGSLPRWNYRNLLEGHFYSAAGCQYLLGCLISSLPPSSPPV